MHYAAIADPPTLQLGDHSSREGALPPEIGISTNKMSNQLPALTWFLQKVPQYLVFEGATMVEDHFLQKAAFLLASAIGYMALQLAAITCHTAYFHVETGNLALMVSASLEFLAKNEQPDDLISPLRLLLSLFLSGGGFHYLCPVHVFKDSVKFTAGIHENHLFYNLKSQEPLLGTPDMLRD